MPERKPESLGFDKPSFVYDHSDDQVEKDTILLNYCIDDIEAMCKVNIELNKSHTPDSDAGSLRTFYRCMRFKRREVAKFKYVHILVHTIE